MPRREIGIMPSWDRKYREEGKLILRCFIEETDDPNIKHMDTEWRWMTEEEKKEMD